MSAEEAHRVARPLFAAGRATPTMLSDVETDHTRARLARVNVQIEMRVA